ncbi:MAG: hypothetical protein P9F19_01400 [Candidatus Contendobacter sp.]|nr:hypothetical protein [Candidatus Contendobacter sp.]MDG4556045.1 hypothetical protein [Candidatus Contendobacter sp.]
MSRAAHVSFRAAILRAFHKIGGVKHLAAWAEDNPTEFYRLAGRLLAQEKPPEPPPEAVQGRFVVATQLAMFEDDRPNPA